MRDARVHGRRPVVDALRVVPYERTSGWRSAFTAPTRSYGDRCEIERASSPSGTGLGGGAGCEYTTRSLLSVMSALPFANSSAKSAFPLLGVVCTRNLSLHPLSEEGRSVRFDATRRRRRRVGGGARQTDGVVRRRGASGS
eukprot:31365-Pelagococcus_subviridis.AAC.18